MTGGHPLVTETPKIVGPTIEQRIRGNDATPDCIVILSGVDQQCFLGAFDEEIGSTRWIRMGALAGPVVATLTLSNCLAPADLKGC